MIWFSLSLETILTKDQSQYNKMTIVVRNLSRCQSYCFGRGLIMCSLDYCSKLEILRESKGVEHLLLDAMKKEDFSWQRDGYESLIK